MNYKKIVEYIGTRTYKSVTNRILKITCKDSERLIDRWSKEEQDLFIQAVIQYGDDRTKIAKVVGTKTRKQVKARIDTLRSMSIDKIPDELKRIYSQRSEKYWSEEESKLLIDATREYGKNHTVVAQLFENKDNNQV